MKAFSRHATTFTSKGTANIFHECQVAVSILTCKAISNNALESVLRTMVYIGHEIPKVPALQLLVVAEHTACDSSLSNMHDSPLRRPSILLLDAIFLRIAFVRIAGDCTKSLLLKHENKSSAHLDLFDLAVCIIPTVAHQHSMPSLQKSILTPQLRNLSSQMVIVFGTSVGIPKQGVGIPKPQAQRPEEYSTQRP